MAGKKKERLQREHCFAQASVHVLLITAGIGRERERERERDIFSPLLVRS